MTFLTKETVEILVLGARLIDRILYGKDKGLDRDQSFNQLCLAESCAFTTTVKSFNQVDFLFLKAPWRDGGNCESRCCQTRLARILFIFISLHFYIKRRTDNHQTAGFSQWTYFCFSPNFRHCRWLRGGNNRPTQHSPAQPAQPALPGQPINKIQWLDNLYWQLSECLPQPALRQKKKTLVLKSNQLFWAFFA